MTSAHWLAPALIAGLLVAGSAGLVAAPVGRVPEVHVVPGFGSLAFPSSCRADQQAPLETAVARLHAFDGPEDAFAAVAAADPGCAVAWWGAAMSVRGNPLAGEPGPDTLAAGRRYVEHAMAAVSPATTPRERDLIESMQLYYRDPGPEGHRARTAAYEAAMRRLATAYPDDPEVASFTGLAILEAVDLTDRSYARQLAAAALLEPVWAANPEHPGAPHYLIHAYDYPPLASRGLPAARRYGEIAYGSVHAQHMPSHIYSMLGLWRDSIAANEDAAHLLCRAPQSAAALDGRDPHGLDFIAYARLQLGQDSEVGAALASAARSEERTIVAARFVLERGDWPGSASLALPPDASALDETTVRFVRALGAARDGHAEAAAAETARLLASRGRVEAERGGYWAGLVDVYSTAAEGWAAWAAGRGDEAIALIGQAAELDDAREKHILLENKLLPVRELLGEVLLAAARPEPALAAFEASLRSAPNRLRSFVGAARAARAAGRTEAARSWSTRAAALLTDADPGRPDLADVVGPAAQP